MNSSKNHLKFTEKTVRFVIALFLLLLTTNQDAIAQNHRLQTKFENKTIVTTSYPLGVWKFAGMSEFQFSNFLGADTVVNGGQGIAVDRRNRIWIGNFYPGQFLRVFRPDGTQDPISPIRQVKVGIDSFVTNSCRGMTLDKDGNILLARSTRLFRLDVNTGKAIKQYITTETGSLLSPMIDKDGFIWTGLVVGINPINVLDPVSLTPVKTIILKNPPGFGRGLGITADAKTILTPDLGESGGPLYLWTTTDFINYNKTDSIFTNDTGELIMMTNRETMNWHPKDSTLWVSVDNQNNTTDNTKNGLYVFDFKKKEYKLLRMPEIGPNIGNGPRGVAFSVTGDTAYAITFNGNRVVRFIRSRTINNQAPSAPLLTSPSANAFTNDNTPALVFNVPQDANGDQLHLKVEIDGDGNFGAGTQTIESKNSITGFSPTPPVTQGAGQVTYTVQSALADGDWWWRVSAWDGQLYGNSSAARKFIVDVTKPSTSNHNPAKGTTSVAINSNIIAHVQDATSGVKQSAIVMKVNGNNVAPAITGTASDLTLTYDPPADFGFQQTINVSIDAADSAGNVMATEAYSFTTLAQGGNSGPAAPTLVALSANNFTNDNTPVLTFNVPTDPNGDQLHFKVEVDDDGNFGTGTQTYESKISTNGFSPTPPVTQGTGQVTYTVQTALADGDWWWRVSAWDGQVYGNVSIARKFIVDQSAPRLTPLPVSPVASGQNQIVSATITDNIGIQTATLFHRQGGAPAYLSAAMINISGDAYQGTISGASINERGVEYYIAVADSADNTRTFPVTNPQAKPQVIQVTTSNLLFKNATPDRAYRMISVPFDLDDESAASVLSDDFPGEYDQIQWRLLRYFDPRTNIEFGSPVFPPFAPGTGFWLITKETKNLDAGPGKSVTTAQNYIVTLPPGWSQIGNPFAFTINWSDVIKGANVENRLVVYQGALNEATGYDYTRTQVVPFEGYFVNNRGSTPTTIEIPPRAATGSAAAKPAADWKSALQNNEWALQITAACDHYLDKDNYLGCLNDASDEWDSNDFSEAPFFDQHVALYFPHPEWKKYPNLYTGDFRETKAEGDYWDFVVKSEVAKSEVGMSEVVLKLAEVQNLPAEWEVVLLDKMSRVAINFSEKKQYAFPSGNDKTMREFRVVVGKKEFVATNDLNLAGVPQAFALGQNYPNPFNPETRIDYELPITNHVKIIVYNLQGQIVRTLFDGEQSAGRYTVSWDGANIEGARVASGVYLLRMEAGRFVAVRKMIVAR